MIWPLLFSVILHVGRNQSSAIAKRRGSIDIYRSMAGVQSHAAIAHAITRSCNRNPGTAITYAALI